MTVGHGSNVIVALLLLGAVLSVSVVAQADGQSIHVLTAEVMDAYEATNNADSYVSPPAVPAAIGVGIGISIGAVGSALFAYRNRGMH